MWGKDDEIVKVTEIKPEGVVYAAAGEVKSEFVCPNCGMKLPDAHTECSCQFNSGNVVPVTALVNPIDNPEDGDMSHKHKQKFHFIPNPYRLRINYKPYTKLWHWIQAAEGEVSGLGVVKKDGNDLIVKDVFLLDQTCSAGHTDLDEEALTNFLYDLAVKGKDPSEYNFWWHSHAHMGTFWSTVDQANCERLSPESELISLVMNKRGDMLARRDFKGHTDHHVPVVIVPTGFQDVQANCYRQVRAKVANYDCGEVVVVDEE